MFERSDGVYVMGSGEQDALPPLSSRREPGRYRVCVRFPGGILNAGAYQFRVALGKVAGGFSDYQYGTCFEIFDDTDYGTTNSGGARNGVILQRLAWSEQRIDDYHG